MLPMVRSLPFIVGARGIAGKRNGAYTRNPMSAKPSASAQYPVILHEDECLLIVDKPSGLLVIPSPKGETVTLGTLVNDLLAARGDGGPTAWPCHRIDRETSGVMVYAKGKAMQKKVMDQFQQRNVHKTYLALVNGCPGKASGSIRTPIEGQEAVTNYLVLGRNERYAAIQVMPVTGRTNQIRIHFARMGHPLLGDAKFGIRKDFREPFKRTALHAWQIRFEHPKTAQELVVSAPVPPDMAALLGALALKV